tara:strand:- start:734 stop:1030 length:297 start_codon:yes stop_codon:yes gene_type:complete
MAKVKTPKIKNLRPEKITPEQLQKMQALISNVNKIQFEIGSIQARNHELLHHHTNLSGNIKELQDELQKEYGTVNVDVKDGTIKYDENGSDNKKDNNR